jgi:hypothetical protein
MYVRVYEESTEIYLSRASQVISVQPAAVEQLSAEICDKLLAPVRPAIEGLGGSVTVRSLVMVSMYACMRQTMGSLLMRASEEGLGGSVSAASLVVM